MTKKLKILVVILLVSLTTFSQTATSNEPQVCLSASKARKVAQDLIRLDSLIQEHNNTVFILQQTKAKLILKDSIINTNEQKIVQYIREIAAHEEKYKTAADRVTKLENDVTTLQKKNKNLQGWVKGLGGGLVSAVTSLVAVILIK